MIGTQWRDVCSAPGLVATPLLTAPLVPYGDETEGSSDQDDSGLVIEVRDLSVKLACGRRRVPSGISVYTRSNTPSDIILGETS